MKTGALTERIDAAFDLREILQDRGLGRIGRHLQERRLAVLGCGYQAWNW